MFSPPILTRQIMRSILNKNIGEVIKARDFFDNIFAANYLRELSCSGFAERISTGRYKILKKIVLRKTGPPKGTLKHNKNIKDLSMIPFILNSSKEGFVVKQIFEMYIRITPPEKQVTMGFLYRLLGFGIKQKIIMRNGTNPEERISKIGLKPKRLILENKDISIEEWNNFVDKYRLWYQYKKENKYGKKSKRKLVAEGFKTSETIIEIFGENRKNENKRFIEDQFINEIQEHIKGEKINCFAVTGPDYNRHVVKLFDKIANNVMICELKSDVFDIIYRKAQVCPYYIDNKVSLLNCNIDDVAPINYHYIDLDLMGCLNNIKESILKKVKDQDYSCDKNNLKFISFTSSIRKDGGKKTRFNSFKNILDEGFELKLDSFENAEGLGNGAEVLNPSKLRNFCLRHVLNVQEFGRVKKLIVFTYQDTSPMMSALIIYK